MSDTQNPPPSADASAAGVPTSNTAAPPTLSNPSASSAQASTISNASIEASPIPGVKEGDLMNCSFVKAPHPSSLIEPPPSTFIILTGGTVLGVLDKVELLDKISKQPGFAMKVVQGWPEVLKEYSKDYFSGRVQFSTNNASALAPAAGPAVGAPRTPSKETDSEAAKTNSPIFVPSTAPTPDLAAGRKRLAEARRLFAEAERRKRLPDGRLRPAFRPPGPVYSIYDVQARQALAPIKETGTIEEWLSQGKLSKKKAVSVSSSDAEMDSASASETEESRSFDSDAFELSPSRDGGEPSVVSDIFSDTANMPPSTQVPVPTPASLSVALTKVIRQAADKAHNQDLQAPGAKRRFVKYLLKDMENALCSALQASEDHSMAPGDSISSTHSASDSSPSPSKKARTAASLIGPATAVLTRSASAPPQQAGTTWNAPSALFGDPNDRTLWQDPCGDWANSVPARVAKPSSKGKGRSKKVGV